MKQDLTPEGVAVNIAASYAMTIANHLAQASAIGCRLKTWVPDNFNLCIDQTTFPKASNSSAANNYGYHFGICFRNILEIALNVPSLSYASADHLLNNKQITIHQKM